MTNDDEQVERVARALEPFRRLIAQLDRKDDGRPNDNGSLWDVDGAEELSAGHFRRLLAAIRSDTSLSTP